MRDCFVMTFRRATLVAAIGFCASAAYAQNCHVVMADLQFCPEGTIWEHVAPQYEVEDGLISVMAFYGREVVLVFSAVPEDQLADLPRRPGYTDVASVLADFSDGYTTYLDAVELDRFAPLGEDVAVASLSLHDAPRGWVNTYSYYIEGGYTLSVQTGDQGATTLTERHRALHLDAVRALTTETR